MTVKNIIDKCSDKFKGTVCENIHTVCVPHI